MDAEQTEGEQRGQLARVERSRPYLTSQEARNFAKVQGYIWEKKEKGESAFPMPGGCLDTLKRIHSGHGWGVKMLGVIAKTAPREDAIECAGKADERETAEPSPYMPEVSWASSIAWALGVLFDLTERFGRDNVQEGARRD
jgi:hypothetical protein